MSGTNENHNKYISCENCPHRSIDPNCHKECKGYQYRLRKNEERKEKILAGRQGRDRKIYRGKVDKQ